MLFPKPEKRKTAKARKRRRAAEFIQRARETCEARDGYCRLRGTGLFGPCRGGSEWAHFGDWKRWKTRGMDPEERHRHDRSLMLCDAHHDLYDAHALRIEALTDSGTAGPLLFSMGTTTWLEAG